KEYEATTFECHLRAQMFASKDEVMAAMENDGICTVNTLTMESYANGHITGSSLNPCTELLQDMARFLSDETLASQLQTEKEYERVITYCGGGIAATVNAIAHLIVGNENVAVYDGSMSEWTGEGLPITKGNGA